MKTKMISDDQKRQIWYNHVGVKFEIVKACRFKEMQIIGEGISIRWLNVQHIGIWETVRRCLNVEKRSGNIYRSLDNYKMIPLMSFNLNKRAEQSKDWAKIRDSNVIGPDFGIDIDCKNTDWKDAIPDAQIIKDLFDSFGVNYGFWCSGFHGFHFVVPFEDMPEDVKNLKYHEIIAFYRAFAGLLAKKARNMDLSIYMATRVLKLPYSLNKSNEVILPLDNEAWEDMKKDKLSLDPLNVLKRFPNIGRRGTNFYGSSEGIKKLIKEWTGF